VLKQIKRYPVKGLVGQKLESTELTADQGIIGDRQFAFTLKDSVDGSQWLQSRNYLINAVNDGLLTIKPDWANLGSIKIELPALVARALSLTELPRLVERSYAKNAAGLWDYVDSQVSIMNLQTLRVVSEAIGQKVDIDRFRGNLIIDDLPAWSEFGLAGWRYKIGEAVVEFSRPMRRCAATEINPESGARDVPVTKLIVEKFGHGYFGIYARVVKSGPIACGDQLSLLGPASMQLDDIMVEGAGRYSFWPKVAKIRGISPQSAQIKIELESGNAWPLVDEKTAGHLKLYLGTHGPIRAELMQNNGTKVRVIVQTKDISAMDELLAVQSIIVSGPYSSNTKANEVS